MSETFPVSWNDASSLPDSSETASTGSSETEIDAAKVISDAEEKKIKKCVIGYFFVHLKFNLET